MKNRVLTIVLIALVMSFAVTNVGAADFRTIYGDVISKYNKANESTHIIDVNNDGIPDLLAIFPYYYEYDGTADPMTAYYTLYSMDEYGNIYTIEDSSSPKYGYESEPDESDMTLYQSGGIDGVLYTSFLSDKFGRVYVNRYDETFFIENSGSGWRFLSNIKCYVSGQESDFFTKTGECVFEETNNDTANWNRYLSERNVYANPLTYTVLYGMNELLRVSGCRSGIYMHSDLIGEPRLPFDPWATWDGPAVSANGRLIKFDDCKPYIENGVTMIPMRKVFDVLGATVEWDDNTRTVTARKGDKVISLTIGSNTVYADGRSIYCDVAPAIEYSRTYVPLRVVSECLGAQVDWDGLNRVVYIKS